MLEGGSSSGIDPGGSTMSTGHKTLVLEVHFVDDGESFHG